jgi:hypothetical protein
MLELGLGGMERVEVAAEEGVVNPSPPPAGSPPRHIYCLERGA